MWRRVHRSDKRLQKAHEQSQIRYRGTPTADTLGVDKHIHYCQLQKYNTFKDPLFRVILFLTVKDQKCCECLEKYYIRKFDTALNEKTLYSRTIKWDKNYNCKKTPFIWKKKLRNHSTSY